MYAFLTRLVSRVLAALRWPAQAYGVLLVLSAAELTCSPAAAQDITSKTTTITSNLYSLGSIAKVVGIIAGAVLTIVGLFRLANHHKNKEPIGGSLSMIVVGVLLFGVSVVITTLSASIFGSDQSNNGNFSVP